MLINQGQAVNSDNRNQIPTKTLYIITWIFFVVVINVKKQIQVRIYPDGKIVAKTVGVKGKQCTQYIPFLEQVLYARTVENMFIDEYYEEENTIEIKESNQIIINE
jgi:hypothetical protein